MDQPVQHGVGDGRMADVFVPELDGCWTIMVQPRSRSRWSFRVKRYPGRAGERLPGTESPYRSPGGRSRAGMEARMSRRGRTGLRLSLEESFEPRHDGQEILVQAYLRLLPSRSRLLNS